MFASPFQVLRLCSHMKTANFAPECPPCSHVMHANSFPGCRPSFPVHYPYLERLHYTLALALPSAFHTLHRQCGTHLQDSHKHLVPFDLAPSPLPSISMGSWPSDFVGRKCLEYLGTSAAHSMNCIVVAAHHPRDNPLIRLKCPMLLWDCVLGCFSWFLPLFPLVR